MKRIKVLGVFLLLYMLLCSLAMATAEFLVSEGDTLPESLPAANFALTTPQPAPTGAAADYGAALQMLEEGDIITALNAFAILGKYEDAAQYTNYAAAKLLFLRNDPAQAAKGFAQLGDFLDSRYLTQLCGIMNCHRYYDGSRFGYVNGLGVIEIVPQFDWAERGFRLESLPSVTSDDPASEDNGLLPVAMVFTGETKCDGTDLLPQSGKYGLLRRDGALVVPVQYDEILWTIEGMAAVRAGESVELYDLLRGEKVGETYTAAGVYAEGCIPVQKDGKWGYVDQRGMLLFGGFLWDSAQPFREGKAGVSENKLAGFIDASGNIVIPLEHQAVSSFSEGLAGFQRRNKWGFLNTSGEIIIKPAYQEVRAFVLGRCAVKRSGKWGAIDPQGKFIVPNRYDEITDFDSIYQRAWMRNNKLWGILSLDGTVVLKPQWASFTPFGADGMSRVSYKGSYGFVDVRGVLRIENAYTAAAPFSADVGGVMSNSGKVEYLSKLGRGFSINSDYPTQPLNGFIEARQITATPIVQADPKTGKETQEYTYGITFALYHANGDPLTGI